MSSSTSSYFLLFPGLEGNDVVSTMGIVLVLIQALNNPQQFIYVPDISYVNVDTPF